MARFHCAALAAIAAIGLVSTASAAEPASTVPWSGYYLGGNLGGVIGHASGTSDFLDPAGPGFASNPQNNSFNETNFIGGIQAGYNWRLGERWIAGAEVDWDWTHSNYGFCRQTNTLSVACAGGVFGSESISSTTDWIATLRGRLGASFGNLLVYGTGGLAWGHIETTLTQNCPILCGSSALPHFISATSDTDRIGWAAGLGLEYAFYGSWSARAEWLYADLGRITSALSAAPADIAPALQTTTWSRREQYNLIRLGVNYHF